MYVLTVSETLTIKGQHQRLAKALFIFFLFSCWTLTHFLSVDIENFAILADANNKLNFHLENYLEIKQTYVI